MSSTIIQFALNNILESVSVRHSHTDIKVPDFSDYRTELSENPVQHSRDNADDKKTFSYISTFGI